MTNTEAPTVATLTTPYRSLDLTADQLTAIWLALGNRVEMCETECWREDDDPQAQTNDPNCECDWARSAREAQALADLMDVL